MNPRRRKFVRRNVQKSPFLPTARNLQSTQSMSPIIIEFFRRVLPSVLVMVTYRKGTECHCSTMGNTRRPPAVFVRSTVHKQLAKVYSPNAAVGFVLIPGATV